MSKIRTGVKIMDNNIRIKTGMQAPHSKPLKASGQTLDPYPSIMKKKVKKKKKRGPMNSEIPGLWLNKPIYHPQISI